jgi:hypothetical protein
MSSIKPIANLHPAVPPFGIFAFGENGASRRACSSRSLVTVIGFYKIVGDCQRYWFECNKTASH